MIAFVFRLENTDIQTRIKGIPVKWMKENYRIMSYGKITDKQREILEYIKQEILNKQAIVSSLCPVFRHVYNCLSVTYLLNIFIMHHSHPDSCSAISMNLRTSHQFRILLPSQVLS